MIIPRKIKEGIEITSGVDMGMLAREIRKNPKYILESNIPSGYSTRAEAKGFVVNHNRRSITVIRSL